MHLKKKAYFYLQIQIQHLCQEQAEFPTNIFT